MSDFTRALPTVHGGASAQLATKAPPAAWYMFWTLCGVTLLRWIDQVVLLVGTEPMRKALALSDVQIGVMQGLGVSLAAAVAAIPLAWLADRFDRRKVLAICILAWSGATLWRAYVVSFGQLMASTVGMAMADAALIPIAYALLPLFFRGRQLSVANIMYYAISNIGFSAAMMFSGGLFKILQSEQHRFPAALQGMESWRLASLLVAIVGPVFALMVLRIRATGTVRPPASAPDSKVSANALHVTLRRYLAAHWRALLGLYGGSVLSALGFVAAMTWLPPAMARHFHVDPGTVGSELGSVEMAATLCGLFGAWLQQKLMGRRHGILVPIQTGPWLYALCAFPYAAIGLFDGRIVIYAAMFVLTTLIIMYNATMPTVYQTVAPSNLRARVTAITMAISIVAVAGSPMLVGYLSDQRHTDSALLTVIAALGVPGSIAAALLLWWVRPHARAAVEFSEKVDAEAT